MGRGAPKLRCGWHDALAHQQLLLALTADSRTRAGRRSVRSLTDAPALKVVCARSDAAKVPLQRPEGHRGASKANRGAAFAQYSSVAAST